VQLLYRPSYTEVANSDIHSQYEAAEGELINSREYSEYVRKKIAQIEIDATLQRLELLPNNWNGSGSENPSPAAVSIARDIAHAFITYGLIPDAIAPSPEGGVAVCFIRDRKYADIECFNSGDILAVRYSANEEPEAWVIQRSAMADDTTIQAFSNYLSN
jgi:hypothetical protein